MQESKGNNKGGTQEMYIYNTTSLHSVVFLYNCIENIEENVVENYIICICIALTQTYTHYAHTHDLSKSWRQEIDIEYVKELTQSVKELTKWNLKS